MSIVFTTEIDIDATRDEIVRDGMFLGQHSFVLSEGDNGTTRLTNTEEFSGALTRRTHPESTDTPWRRT